MTRSHVIMIVDDYDDNRVMYAEYLAHAGYDVVEAASGLEAVDKALAARPDLIVMDLALPGMDGCEATRILKGDDRTRDVPVLALTGHAQSVHVERARAAGCDRFLAKPCLPRVLMKAIRDVLGEGS